MSSPQRTNPLKPTELFPSPAEPREHITATAAHAKAKPLSGVDCRIPRRSWEQDKRRREAQTGAKTREPTREGGSPRERQRGPGTPCFSRERQGLGLGPNAGRRQGHSPEPRPVWEERSPKDQAKRNLDGTGLPHPPHPVHRSGAETCRGRTSQTPLPTGLWPGEGRSTSPNKRSTRTEREEVSRSGNHPETAS